MESKLRTIASIATIGALTLFAFNQETRNTIKMRANYKCEVTGREDLPMDCIHLDHTKGVKQYNSPDNGLYGTILVHLAHHMIYRDFPKAIGLKYSENEWAINALKERCLTAYNGDQQAMQDDYEIAKAKLQDYLSAKLEQ